MSAQYGLGDNRKKSLLVPNLIVGAILFWALVCFFLFGHWAGSAFDWQEGLGRPLNLFGLQTYGPLAVLGWPKELWTYGAVDKAFQNSLMCFAAGSFLVCFLYFGLNRSQGAVKDLHGSARWARRKDIEDMGYLGGQGVYVGGFLDKARRRLLYLRHNGPEHILCFAPTRSGKGVGLILPTLLAWPDSVVVLDIKGENYALTSGFRKSQEGQRVLRFDPADTSGRAVKYNPLAEVRLCTPHAIADIQQITQMILDPEGRGLEDYWNKAAFGFLGGVILHCLIMSECGDTPKRASLYDVSLMLEDPNLAGGPKELFEIIRDTDHVSLLKEKLGLADGLAQAMHIFCASAAQGMLAKADKERAGVVSTATANLALYRDSVVAANTSQSDFQITELMRGESPTSLYLVISPADIDRLRPLMRIFISQLLGRLTEKMEFAENEKPQHRLLLMLDEFTSLGKLPIVERAIAYMAGYGIKGYFIVQDTKQLSAAYGQDNAIMANCHIRIAYAPNLPETAEYLSKMTGTTTVVQRKRSVSTGKGGGSSTSVQETARPLLTPDECLRLPGIHFETHGFFKKVKEICPGNMLIFTAGRPPILGTQILHFKDPVFLARTKMQPADSGSINLYKSAKEAAEKEAANAYLKYLSDMPEDIEEAA